MSSPSEGIGVLCANLLSERTNGVLGDKIDELIPLLFKDIVDGISSSRNTIQTLHQVLILRTRDLNNVSNYTSLLPICQFLVHNITGNSVICNRVDHQSNVHLLQLLEISFETLIRATEDDICLDCIQSIVKKIYDEDFSIQTDKIQWLLNAVECLLNALISAGTGSAKNLPKTIDFLISNSFNSLIIDIILKFDSGTLSSFALYALVPKLVKVTKIHSVVNILWNHLNSIKISQTISLSIKLFVLCGLADFLRPTIKTDNFCLIEVETFWKLVQEGLISEDTQLRKQALYLLKRAVDVVASMNISINVHLFSWNALNSDSLKQTWEKMFILFEVLEEKQAHLVIPVMQSVLKATDVFNNIHPSWIMLGYKRLLSHDSLQVIKLGIMYFLELKIEYLLSCPYTGVIDILFHKLNNMLLYCCHPDRVDWSTVDIALKKWFVSISTPNIGEELLSTVVHAMIRVQWCTIPLFHVLYNMSLSPAVNMFSETNLMILSDFHKEAIKTQNIFIRGAVQCAILNIMASSTKKTIDLLHVANTLSVFRHTECLKRGLRSWEVAKEWISSCIDLYEEDKIITQLFIEQNSISVEAKARSLVLFVDSGLINPSGIKFKEVMKEYFSDLEDTYKRPYASVDESDKCLKFILNVLRESTPFSTEFSGQSNDLIRNIIQYINESVFYIQKRLFEIDQLENFESIELYIDVLQVISDTGFVSWKEAVNLYIMSEEVCFNSKYHPVQRLFSLKIICWYIRFCVAQKGKIQETSKQIKAFCLSVIKDGHLQLNLNKTGSDEISSRIHQVYWGCLLSGYTCTLWSVLQECLDENIVCVEEVLCFTSPEDIIQLAISSIECGGRESVIPILKVIKYIFPCALKNNIICQRFLRFSWESCFELRKITLFWPSIKAWVELAFSRKVIAVEEICPNIIIFSEEILKEGEAVNGLSNVLLSHIRRELTDVESIKALLKTVLKALVFGLVPRKDQSPGYGDSQEVRVSALSALLGVVQQTGGVELIVSAVKQLIQMDNQLTAKRQRYHGDSLHHRIKHRILQAILVLHQEVANSTLPSARSCMTQVVKWATTGLQGESQQPSVRYQLEWLLVRALLSSPELLTHFWEMFNESSEERTGSVCSFISVAYHLAASLRDAQFIDSAVSEILPWCMAQQFNIRLYAQVVLEKLWPLSNEVASKYKAVHNSLVKSLNQGNTMRNVDKLKQDFYFTAFHPCHHFTLETIFWELPRLSNISRDEWIPLSTVKNSLSNYEGIIPLENPDDSLKQFNPSSWVSKATAECTLQVETLAMQKKFVPWKSMFPELDASLSHTELIVVASLIDKLPNLGGLTRTCEIFAAECLVVPSLEFTRDKMFSTLSMTAEKHINIIEVKPFDLPKYLREKKSLGYTLVGAEQTASSVSLESFNFPKKSLLLLGNEKEGVPMNLLPLMDVCVEIPQLGVVRSLNVHVTGALFVWEYTKQYLNSTGRRGLTSS